MCIRGRTCCAKNMTMDVLEAQQLPLIQIIEDWTFKGCATVRLPSLMNHIIWINYYTAPRIKVILFWWSRKKLLYFVFLRLASSIKRTSLLPNILGCNPANF